MDLALNNLQRLICHKTKTDNNSIEHYSFVCTQLNDSKYCYASIKNQLNITHLSIPFNEQTVLFLTIQLV